MSNYDRLVTAGILNPNASTSPSQEDLDKIESLSEAEVDHLISAKEKLGDAFLAQHASPTDSFVVF
ncbi:MAG TPA: hypothetical protein VJ623_11460 [Holophagaceae bacterium]|nr:hypothetical protein [Holophagaceae bacterium]